ncbi:MAG: DegT/DnrJ/EryC1/StrS family aminotransferase [Candidatus Omnitrophica bacterium]|nr:DegT/DnrJ/EryC1/StrS family aminotransferase [Candidatus Omnitrophota bacterium]
MRAGPGATDDLLAAGPSAPVKRPLIPVAAPSLTAREHRYVNQCLRSGWISPRGPFVARFEQRFSRACGARYGVATCNGTAALHLALAVAGVGPGDEVIVPGFTFIATANTAVYLDAKPIFADIDPVTWTLDPTQAARRLTRRTKAIIAVHMYGHPVDMQPLRHLAHRRRLALIEDAAQAPGARYRGARVGSLGDAAVFSFDVTKILTTGEGGMLVTSNRRWAKQARLLRDHGMDPRRHFYHPVIGYNYRMTNLQAAIGVAQVERLRQLLTLRRRHARRYARGLAGVPHLTLPSSAAWADHVYWMYAVLVHPQSGFSRDRFMRALAREGIETRPFFPPVHRQPPYRTNRRLPVVEAVCARGVTLPSGATLTEGEIDRVCRVIRRLLRTPWPT